MRSNLTLITLGVKDFELMQRFYQNGLGFKPSSASQEGIVFFQLAGMVLALYSYEKLAEDVGVKAEGNGFAGITLAHNARSIEEVDAVMEQAETAGAKILKKPEKVFWGGYSGYFSDPEGYVWEVAFNPYFVLNERGELVLPS